MEEELRALLLADAAVAALAGDRVNFGSHPQGAGFPALVLNTVSGTDGFHMQGPNNLLEARVQVDCYGLTYGAAKGLSRAVIALLHTYRGGGFQLIVQASSRDSRARSNDDLEIERKFRVSLDFNTNWRET